MALTASGALSKTLTFSPLDQNASGYDAALPAITLTITGTVVSMIGGTLANQAITDQASLSPFSGVVIADAHSGQTETVTVTVTMSAPANGTLSNLAGGAYNAATGVYTVSGSTAAVTSALGGLVFTPTDHQVAGGQTLTTGFTIAVSDSAGDSATDSTTSVTTTAAVPYGAGNSLAYTPLSAPVAIDGALGINVAAATPPTGAQVAITGNFVAGDLLNFTAQNGIVGSYNAATGVLTLSGAASAAAYQAALESITYSSSATNPSNSGAETSRTVSWSISYGGLVSPAVTSTIAIGKTFTLGLAIDHVTPTTGNNLILAAAKALSKGDVISPGGAGNVLKLTGGGASSLALPTTLANIGMVAATEGAGAALPTITLRNGLNVTLNLTSGTGAGSGAKVIGAKDASIINLGNGADTVTLGAAAETVTGGSGKDTFNVNSSTIGATINGGGGASTLAVLTGGTLPTAVMGANITNIKAVTVAAGLTFVANGLNLTITPAAATDNLTGGGGADIFDVNATTIGATINGGTGHSTLAVLGGGSATMGANITNIAAVTLAAGTHFTANNLNLTMTGSKSVDTIIAGSGADVITGGGGADLLVGGSGADTFKDTAADLALSTIQNFTAADTIDISNSKPTSTTTATWASGVLTVAEGTRKTLIKLPGSFTGAFTVSSDGASGMDIRYTPAPAAPQTTLLTQAMAALGGAEGNILEAWMSAHTPSAGWGQLIGAR